MSMNRSSGILNDPSDSCAEGFAGFIVTSFSVCFLYAVRRPFNYPQVVSCLFLRLEILRRGLTIA
jgi:hypothetical protein